MDESAPTLTRAGAPTAFSTRSIRPESHKAPVPRLYIPQACHKPTNSSCLKVLKAPRPKVVLAHATFDTVFAERGQKSANHFGSISSNAPQHPESSCFCFLTTHCVHSVCLTRGLGMSLEQYAREIKQRLLRTHGNLRVLSITLLPLQLTKDLEDWLH